MAKGAGNDARNLDFCRDSVIWLAAFRAFYPIHHRCGDACHFECLAFEDTPLNPKQPGSVDDLNSKWIWQCLTNQRPDALVVLIQFQQHSLTRGEPELFAGEFAQLA